MNEELFKKLLQLKISVTQRATEVLPEVIQKPIKELETQLMRCLYDITKEYIDRVPASENTKQAGGLKSIDVI